MLTTLFHFLISDANVKKLMPLCQQSYKILDIYIHYVIFLRC
jgi:hypothetical protein